MLRCGLQFLHSVKDSAADGRSVCFRMNKLSLEKAVGTRKVGKRGAEIQIKVQH